MEKRGEVSMGGRKKGSADDSKVGSFISGLIWWGEGRNKAELGWKC